jgi:1,2-diacylglycerol 3-alpha-glucosyltransferase
MRIAIFTDVFLPSLTGVSSSVFLLAKALVRRGHFVKIFTPKIKNGQLAPKNLEGVEISYEPSIPSLIYPEIKLGLPIYPKTIYQLIKNRIDIVHFHTPLPISADGILAAKLLNKPIVGTFHTYFMEPEYLRVIGIKIKQQTVLKTIVKLGWQYAKLYYNAANIITVPTNSTKKMLQKHRIARPIRTISNGIDTRIISKNSSIDHTKNSFLISVSRLSREKNIDAIIRGFKIVHNQKSDYKLLIIGDGPAKKSLQRLVEKERLKKHIVFKGAVPYEKLMSSDIYDRAALFITASTSETQGLSIIEAMARGLPIVGIAERGVRDLIKKNGHLCKTTAPQEIASAVIEILKNPKRARKMSEQSIRLSKKYSIDFIAKQFEALYKKTLKQKKKRKFFSWL